MKLAFALVAAASIAGCASRTTMMLNDSGQVHECSASGWGWLGTPVALISHQNCVSSARDRGFRPAEEMDQTKVDKSASALK